MAYKGRYTPKNPKKYKGDYHNIIYRSSWERKFMVYCDNSDNILEWGSEEIIIPYLSPWDGKLHRYFPDFYIKVKRKDGNIKKMIVEIKPEKYTKPPVMPKKKTKSYVKDVYEWGRNEAKWKSALEYCKDRGMDFLILTEQHLMPKYK